MIIFWSGISIMTLAALWFVGRASWLITTLFLILVALVWEQWGNQQDVTQWLELKRTAVAVNELKKELGNDPDAVVARLQKQLTDNPDSAKGWYLLGKLYLSQQKFLEAVDIFAKANKLQPDNPEIIMYYAQVLFITKQYQAAITQWEKLRSYYPVGSEDAKALEAAIEQAQKLGKR